MPDPTAFDSILADLQAKHPDAEVEPLNYAGGRMIVRTPDEGSYAKFITDSGDSTKRAQAAKALARRCILWPSLDELDALFARKPGLVARIVDKLLDKAGAGDEVTLGK
jgi:hypothetical protein